jgi:2-C-methyl-D-erythritol 4-phosphate cytidylyltransferase
MSKLPNFWVVIPAAGSARRMAADIPKQYLRIAGRTVIEHALAPFLSMSECRGVVVALAAEDVRFQSLDIAREPRVRTVVGGAERVDSVRAALTAIAADDREWVLVHDAARPCLTAADLEILLRTLHDDEVGGLLAAPVVDTLKRADEQERVAATVDRAALWHALTPQMFRYGVLQRALAGAGAITDDSQAVEALGLAPKLVRGSAENLKITVPDDLARAERILLARNVR